MSSVASISVVWVTSTTTVLPTTPIVSIATVAPVVPTTSAPAMNPSPSATTTITVCSTIQTSIASATSTSIPAHLHSGPTDGFATALIIAISWIALFCALLLGYLIYLRFRGRCPSCDNYKKQLAKWQSGELHRITAEDVQEREAQCAEQQRQFDALFTGEHLDRDLERDNAALAPSSSSRYSRNTMAASTKRTRSDSNKSDTGPWYGNEGVTVIVASESRADAESRARAAGDAAAGDPVNGSEQIAKIKQFFGRVVEGVQDAKAKVLPQVSPAFPVLPTHSGRNTNRDARVFSAMELEPIRRATQSSPDQSTVQPPVQQPVAPSSYYGSPAPSRRNSDARSHGRPRQRWRSVNPPQSSYQSAHLNPFADDTRSAAQEQYELQDFHGEIADRNEAPAKEARPAAGPNAPYEIPEWRQRQHNWCRNGDNV